jgi:cytochrome c biogenesis protein CcmG/thiol:disulfide interchange protein DsbE
MRRSPVPVAVIVLAILLVGGLGYGIATHTTSTTLDTAVREGRLPVAPKTNVELPRLGAPGTASLASYRGKIVVLNIWASWCVPCRDEAPLMRYAQDQLTAKGDGTVLGVTHDDLGSKSLGLAKELKMNYPSLRDPNSDIYGAFGSTGVPETFVINKTGHIVAISRGPLSGKSFINAAIAKARAT